MMVSALTVVCLRHVSGYDDDMLKILPGAAAAALIYGISIGRSYLSRNVLGNYPNR